MLYSMWNLSSLTRDWTRAPALNPALEVQSLNHWITREGRVISYCCILVSEVIREIISEVSLKSGTRLMRWRVENQQGKKWT